MKYIKKQIILIDYNSSDGTKVNKKQVEEKVNKSI